MVAAIFLKLVDQGRCPGEALNLCAKFSKFLFPLFLSASSLSLSEIYTSKVACVASNIRNVKRKCQSSNVVKALGQHTVRFRKRTTSRSPRGIYLPVTHVCFFFDRPLWFVWWSDGLFRDLVLLFRSSLDWFNQEDATASVWKWCFNVSLRWPRMEWHSRRITQTSK